MLKKNIVLNERQQDVLREIANMCAGNAATSLSQLLNRKIEMNVPNVHLLRVENVPDVVGGAENLVVGIVCQVFGDAPGVILLLFPQQDARSLAGILTGQKIKNGILTEMDQSAIKEAGSILAASYLNTLSGFTGINLIPSTPGIVIDMAGALIDYILIELSAVCEYALLIDSKFVDADKSVRGNFFLLPNPGSLETILKAIGE
ncbi:MAG: chemotaxis protein CheC [Candidatus Omnitrophica bacterium]|nr:chemotaxis protein CheC [Candidatus Omnitrophota bacterium]